MFVDEISEKFYAHPSVQQIPFGAQPVALNVLEEILEDILEVNPYAVISELFADSLSAADVPTEL